MSNLLLYIVTNVLILFINFTFLETSYSVKNTMNTILQLLYSSGYLASNQHDIIQNMDRVQWFYFFKDQPDQINSQFDLKITI